MADSSINESLLTPNARGKFGDLRGRIWEESKKIWRIATPSMVARVSSFGTIVVTQSFVGHISAVDLAGYALVQTLTVRFVNGVLIGMSSATETLCGQAFGAKQYQMLGIYLQRSWLIDLITLTILLPIFVFGAQIFKLLGQDGGIAKSAGYISLWFIPYIYALVFGLTVQMYLQAQQRNMIIAWLSALQFAIHILCSWLFVYVFDLGVAGAMAALCLSSWVLVTGEFVYIFGGWCPESWGGFDSAAFKDLWPVVKLSVSSGVMMCLEIWYYAILVLLASYMKDAQVAISAFSICSNVAGWILMIIIGLMGASCVRVANELGRGDAKAVRFSIKVLMATSSSIGIFFWIICFLFSNKISYLFTDDEAVAHTISDLSLLLAFTVLLASIYPVLSGVAIGSGLQTKVAVINLVCFYAIGLPIGIVLGYVLHLQVEGIWLGLTCGVLAQTFSMSFLIWRTNWDQEICRGKMGKKADLSGTHRTQLMQYLLERFKDGKLQHGKITEAAAKFNCCRKSVERIWKIIKEQRDQGEVINVPKQHSKRKRKLIHNIDYERIQGIPKEDRTTIESLSEVLGPLISRATVGRWAKTLLRHHSNAIKPLLTALQMLNRLLFSLQALRYDFTTNTLKFKAMENTVHIDEIKLKSP